MAVKARSYEAANIVLTVLGIIAWLQIGIGLLGLFAGGLGGNSQLEVTLTIGMKFISAITVLSGLVSLALVQMARANVHTAEINWEMLQILRDNPRSAQNSGHSSGRNAQNFTNSPEQREAGNRVKVHKGREILRRADGVSVDGKHFANVLEAERYINSQTP